MEDLLLDTVCLREVKSVLQLIRMDRLTSIDPKV